MVKPPTITYPLGSRNVCTKDGANPYDSPVFHKTRENLDLLVTRGKVKGSPHVIEYILWGA